MFDVIVDVHLSRSSRKTLQWKQLPVGLQVEAILKFENFNAV